MDGIDDIFKNCQSTLSESVLKQVDRVSIDQNINKNNKEQPSVITIEW